MVDDFAREASAGWIDTPGTEAGGVGCLLFFGVLIVALLLGLNAPFAFLIAVVFAAGAFMRIRRAKARKAEQRRRAFEAKVIALVDPHMPALLRRRRQLVQVDDYGIRNNLKWQKEVNRFCDNIIFPALGAVPPLMPNGAKSAPRFLVIDKQVLDLVEDAAVMAKKEFVVEFNPNMAPIDYEHFCAERLKLSGWQPRVTQSSGDQGADIVAVKGRATIVVQCKHYRAAVGNKAVQEVAAAVRHYSADAGIVVATNGFTKSAEQLAATNGVLLLSHDDLTSKWQL